MTARIDISSELNVIAIEPYGDAVKTAVHDAIQKVNSGGGESKNEGPQKIDRLFEIVHADGSADALILANDILAACAPGIAVEELDPMNVNLLRLTWENRYGNPDTGEFSGNPTNRIVCIDYIEVPNGCTREVVSMTGTADSYYAYVYYYDSSRQYLGVIPWRQTDAASDYIFPGAKYLRLGFRSSDNADISYGSISECTVSFSVNSSEEAYDMTNLTWENRSGDDSTGQFYGDPSNRLACVDYITLPSGRTQVSIAMFAADANYDKYIYYYDSDKRYLGYDDYTTASTVRSIWQGASYARFGFKRQDGQDLSGQTIRSCFAIFS